ncbi:MAG: hypothetical protein ABIP79_06260 [Chitinophagaceae bacterium]
MRKIISSLCFSLLIVLSVNAQVGIGTNAPHAKAALEIKSTDKGVLFPRMTTAQRDAIADPPQGLHIYNTDEECLNYYTSLFHTWVGYCDGVKNFVTIKITANASAIDFYNTYAKNYPGTKNFIIIVQSGVTLASGGTFIPGIGLVIPIPALTFTGMASGTSIKIINYGNIVGATGSGGNGPKVGANSFNDCAYDAANGNAGGDAIGTTAGISITVDNYGIIAGGGGGGGGGGRNSVSEYGGGGGGGAGFAPGGTGGGTTILSCFFNTCNCVFTRIAQNGNPGLFTTGGTGGAGASNGGAGGNGGGLGLAGQNGIGTNAGLGGLPGRAVFSNGVASGIIINNLNGGQVFGVVQ